MNPKAGHSRSLRPFCGIFRANGQFKDAFHFEGRGCIPPLLRCMPVLKDSLFVFRWSYTQEQIVVRKDSTTSSSQSVPKWMVRETKYV